MRCYEVQGTKLFLGVPMRITKKSECLVLGANSHQELSCYVHPRSPAVITIMGDGKMMTYERHVTKNVTVWESPRVFRATPLLDKYGLVYLARELDEEDSICVRINTFSEYKKDAYGSTTLVKGSAKILARTYVESHDGGIWTDSLEVLKPNTTILIQPTSGNSKMLVYTGKGRPFITDPDDKYIQGREEEMTLTETQETMFRNYVECYHAQGRLLIVTRHAGLVEYIRSKGLVPEDTPVMEQVNEDDVRGKVVVGILPLRLAVLAVKVIEFPLKMTKEDRGKELSLERIKQIVQPPTIFHVAEIPPENLSQGVPAGLISVD